MSSRRSVRWFAPFAIVVILASFGCGSSGGGSNTGTTGTGTGGTGTGGTGTGTTTSAIAISTQPQSSKSALGSAVTLSVTATGNGALTYQWYKGGVAIAGATGASYTIGSVAASHAGRYYVKVSDAGGAMASDVAVVTPTNNGVAVDAWDPGDGFNPADETANVTFPYTVSLTGSSNGLTVAATGLSTTSTSASAMTFSDGSNTVIVNTSVNPITVTSTIASGLVKYALSGTHSAGVRITSASNISIALNDASITSNNGAPIYVNSAVRSFVELSGTSTLTDASPASATVNAAIYSKGSLLFTGSGTANITSGADYESHGVQAKEHIRLSNGTLNIKTRYNPIAKDVNTSNVYALYATTAFVMDGGVLIVNSADENANAAKTVPPGWGRGVGVKGVEGGNGFLVVNDGVVSITTYDKAMTAKWKCYDSTTPADSDGDKVCNTTDPNPFVTINGGRVTIRATGITCDPADRMTYNTTTCTGASSAKVSPEGIEAKSVFTMNGGTVDIQSRDDALNAGISYSNPYGNNVVVNGGFLSAASSGNDGIDANATSSPGITVNGGVVIANGIGAPEEGFDADRYTVALNGGTAIGIGGNNSTIDTSSKAKYGSITRITTGRTLAIWQGTSSAGSVVLAYQVPTVTGTAALAAVISNPALVSGGSYTYFFTDAANVSCSEWATGLCVGTMSATYASLGTGTALTVR